MSVAGSSRNCPSKRLTLHHTSFDSIVEVAVGEHADILRFHKTVLISAAHFFHAALEGSFKEAAEHRITLPEEKLEVVQRFQLWLYSGSPIAKEEQAISVFWQVLVDLYILGECYDIPDLCNATIDALACKRMATGQFNARALHSIYAKTKENSALRRFYIEDYASNGDASQDEIFLQPTSELYPHQYLIELVAELHKTQGHRIELKLESLGCKYHVHN